MIFVAKCVTYIDEAVQIILVGVLGYAVLTLSTGEIPFMPVGVSLPICLARVQFGAFYLAESSRRVNLIQWQPLNTTSAAKCQIRYAKGTSSTILYRACDCPSESECAKLWVQQSTVGHSSATFIWFLALPDIVDTWVTYRLHVRAITLQIKTREPSIVSV